MDKYIIKFKAGGWNNTIEQHRKIKLSFIVELHSQDISNKVIETACEEYLKTCKYTYLQYLTFDHVISIKSI